VGEETPSAAKAVPTPTGTACGVPVAAGWGGLGFLGRRAEHSGGEAEQRQSRVAQKAAAPEPYFREVLFAEALLEIRKLPVVYRNTNSPPLDFFLLCNLYEAFLFRRTVSGLHEPDEAGGALVQVGLSGDRSALDLEGERRAF
jgi:hypothetical protein